MLNENQRRFVEGIRRSNTIKVIGKVGDTVFEVKASGRKGLAHDIAIAVQKYFNEQNEGKDA